ncbi:uncharacterized protein B0T15DRAFT_36706 [Chaetomium strumarium]|uniref:Uncharacterized protein n=1 Tax=Chaetomium strumarium TaxID=1170767 RepID=A0AAJ0H260_9PEZI|nr:hypothetical protein B0T15DRAFT_36706 [Chaetomium strumarium]
MGIWWRGKERTSKARARGEREPPGPAAWLHVEVAPGTRCSVPGFLVHFRLRPGAAADSKPKSVEGQPLLRPARSHTGGRAGVRRCGVTPHQKRLFWSRTSVPVGMPHSHDACLVQMPLADPPFAQFEVPASRFFLRTALEVRGLRWLRRTLSNERTQQPRPVSRAGSGKSFFGGCRAARPSCSLTLILYFVACSGPGKRHHTSTACSLSTNATPIR